MSFVAGAITGNLILDTSGFTGGIAGAISAATAGGPSIAAPILAGLDLIQKTASAVFHFVADAVKEAGAEFDNMGEAAQKAGVSTEFLSSVGAAASDAGSSVEGLGDALKFLNKNAAEAAAGDETAVKSFAKLGLSADEVKANLGDTEALFARVVDGIGGLGTTAEKTGAAMGLLGRGGSDLIPLIESGSEGIQAFRDQVGRLGGTISKEAAEGGDKFGKLSTLIDVAWKGIRNAVAEPILSAIGQDSEDLEGTVERISAIVREAIPPALQLILGLVKLVLGAADELLGVLQGVAALSDAIGVTTTAGQSVGSAREGVQALQKVAGDVQINLSATFDPDAATSQIAAKLQPDIRAIYDRQAKDLEGSARRGVVAASVGGRAS